MKHRNLIIFSLVHLVVIYLLGGKILAAIGPAVDPAPIKDVIYWMWLSPVLMVLVLFSRTPGGHKASTQPKEH